MTLKTGCTPHKNAFDFGQTGHVPQLDSSGKHATHFDSWLGIPYEMLDELSVREQRLIVKKRVQELHKMQLVAQK